MLEAFLNCEHPELTVFEIAGNISLIFSKFIVVLFIHRIS